MTAADWSSLVTAIASAITAIGGLLVTVFVLIPARRTGKDTHNIVNSQREAMRTYQEDLTGTLTEHGIDIPRDKSIQP